ncbi:ADP-ribosyltransferase [Vibrio mimicus]
MKITMFLILICLSLNSFANDYFNDLLKPDSPREILINKEKGFAKWSKAAFDYSNKYLSQTESIALNDYTGYHYKIINQYLRNPKLTLEQYGPKRISKLGKTIENIKSGLKKLPSYKGKVFRGGGMKISLIDKLKVGDILVEPAFLSTSFLPETAKNFADNFYNDGVSSKVLFEINVEHSAYALPLVSKLEGEAEILISSGSPLKIVHMDEISGVRYIAMKTIDSLEGFNGSVYNSYTGSLMKTTDITKPLVEQAGGVHNVCNVI